MLPVRPVDLDLCAVDVDTAAVAVGRLGQIHFRVIGPGLVALDVTAADDDRGALAPGIDAAAVVSVVAGDVTAGDGGTGERGSGLRRDTAAVISEVGHDGTAVQDDVAALRHVDTAAVALQGLVLTDDTAFDVGRGVARDHDTAAVTVEGFIAEDVTGGLDEAGLIGSTVRGAGAGQIHTAAGGLGLVVGDVTGHADGGGAVVGHGIQTAAQTHIGLAGAHILGLVLTDTAGDGDGGIDRVDTAAVDGAVVLDHTVEEVAVLPLITGQGQGRVLQIHAAAVAGVGGGSGPERAVFVIGAVGVVVHDGTVEDGDAGLDRTGDGLGVDTAAVGHGLIALHVTVDGQDRGLVGIGGTVDAATVAVGGIVLHGAVDHSHGSTADVDTAGILRRVVVLDVAGVDRHDRIEAVDAAATGTGGVVLDVTAGDDQLAALTDLHTATVAPGRIAVDIALDRDFGAGAGGVYAAAFAAVGTVAADVALHGDGTGIGQIGTAAVAGGRVLLDVTVGHVHIGAPQIDAAAIGGAVEGHVTAGHGDRGVGSAVDTAAVVGGRIAGDGTAGDDQGHMAAVDAAALRGRSVISHVTALDVHGGGAVDEDTAAAVGLHGAGGLIILDRAALDRTGAAGLEGDAAAAVREVAVGIHFSVAIGIHRADGTAVQSEAGMVVTEHTAAPALGYTAVDGTAVHDQTAIGADEHAAAVGAVGISGRDLVILDGTAVDGDAVVGTLCLSVVQPDARALDVGLVVGNDTAVLGLILDVFGRIGGDVAILVQIPALRVDLPGPPHEDGSAAVDGDTAAAALGLDHLVVGHPGDVGLVLRVTADGTAGDGTHSALTGQEDAAAVAVVGDVGIDLAVGDRQPRVAAHIGIDLVTEHVDAAAITAVARAVAGLVIIDTAIIDQDLLPEVIHLLLDGRIRIGRGGIVDTAAVLAGVVIMHRRAVQLEFDGVVDIASIRFGLQGDGIGNGDGDTAAIDRGVPPDLRIGIEDQVVGLALRGAQITGGAVVDLLGDGTATLVSDVALKVTVLDIDLGLHIQAAAVTLGMVAIEVGARDGQRGDHLGPGSTGADVVGVPVDAAAVIEAGIAQEFAVADRGPDRGVTDASEGTVGIVGTIDLRAVAVELRAGDIDDEVVSEVAAVLDGAVVHGQGIHDTAAEMDRVAAVSCPAAVDVQILQIHLLGDHIVADTDRAAVVPGIAVREGGVLGRRALDRDGAAIGAAQVDRAATAAAVEDRDLDAVTVGIPFRFHNAVTVDIIGGRGQITGLTAAEVASGDRHVPGDGEEQDLLVLGRLLQGDRAAEAVGDAIGEGAIGDGHGLVGAVRQGDRAAHAAVANVVGEGTAAGLEGAHRDRLRSITVADLDAAAVGGRGITQEDGVFQRHIAHRGTPDGDAAATGAGGLTVRKGQGLRLAVLGDRLAARDLHIADRALDGDTATLRARGTAAEGTVGDVQISLGVARARRVLTGGDHQPDRAATVTGGTIHEGTAAEIHIGGHDHGLIAVTDVDRAAVGA